MDKESVLPDLPMAENESLRNVSAAQKFKQMGDKNGGQGQQWLQAAQHASQSSGTPLWWIASTIDRENANWQPALKANGSSATGLGMMIKSTAHSMGVNPEDPISSIYGVANLLGQLKQQVGTNDFGEVTHAYILGPTGYNRYVQTGSATGSDQIPSADRFLANIGVTPALDANRKMSMTPGSDQKLGALAQLQQTAKSGDPQMPGIMPANQQNLQYSNYMDRSKQVDLDNMQSHQNMELASQMQGEASPHDDIEDLASIKDLE